MDIGGIASLISTVGFPMGACLLLGWYVKDQTDKNNARIDRMQENHTNEMKEITSAINNNTVVMTKLCTIVERGE